MNIVIFATILQIHLEEQAGKRACLCYCEDISKNHQGGLKGRHVKPKVVVHYENVENPSCCFIRLYKLYQSKCPPNRPNNAFYLRPLKNLMLLVFGILPSPSATVNSMALLLRCAKLLGLVVLKLTTPSVLQLLHDSTRLG